MVATLNPPFAAIGFLEGANSGRPAGDAAGVGVGVGAEMGAGVGRDNAIPGEAAASSTPEEEMTTVANRCGPGDSCGSPGMPSARVIGSLFSGKR